LTSSNYIIILGVRVPFYLIGCVNEYNNVLHLINYLLNKINYDCEPLLTTTFNWLYICI